MENLENKDQNQENKYSASQVVISKAVLIGILTGVVSGFFGGAFVVRNPGFLNSVFRDSAYQGTVQNGGTVIVNEDSAVVETVKKTSPAVVSIIISKNLNQSSRDLFSPFFLDPFFQFRNPTDSNQQEIYRQVGAGSGFFVSSDGLIMTNKHVVNDTQARYTVLTNDGKQYEGKVVAQDPVNDLALVKIDIQDAPALKFANSDNLQIGQKAIAIGNSLGQYSNTVTTGVVSGIGRNIVAGGGGTSEQLENVVQTDAAINPGNSGGPLLDILGNVVGVNTAIDQEGQSVGFAIPSNDAQKDLESYQRLGRIAKPFLGVRYVLIDQTVQEENNLPVSSGAWVTSQAGSVPSDPAVVPESAAAKAGIREGDIIVAVNGSEVNAKNTLARLLRNFQPGDRVTLDVYRDSRIQKIEVSLGEVK
jgi:serine protease Do